MQSYSLLSYLERDVALLDGDTELGERGVIGEEPFLEPPDVGVDIRVRDAQR